MKHLMEKIRWTEVTRRIILYSLFLTCGGRLVCSDQGITVCDNNMEKLKEDVEEWKTKCVTGKGKNEINTKCCKDEKQYNKERIRMITEMCFHDGKNILLGMNYMKYIKGFIDTHNYFQQDRIVPRKMS